MPIKLDQLQIASSLMFIGQYFNDTAQLHGGPVADASFPKSVLLCAVCWALLWIYIDPRGRIHRYLFSSLRLFAVLLTIFSLAHTCVPNRQDNSTKCILHIAEAPGCLHNRVAGVRALPNFNRILSHEQTAISPSINHNAVWDENMKINNIKLKYRYEMRRCDTGGEASRREGRHASDTAIWWERNNARCHLFSMQDCRNPRIHIKCASQAATQWMAILRKCSWRFYRDIFASE